MVSEGDKVKAAFKAFLTGVVVALVLDITANLTAPPSRGGTPVDTGWARANWVPSIGEPTFDPVGNRESVTSSEQEAGLAFVATSYKIFNQPEEVFISNNVPYILKLNEGSSTQAPRGFIQAAILKAVKTGAATRP